MLNSAVGVLTRSPFSPTWRRAICWLDEGEKVRRRWINNNIDTCVTENLQAAAQIPFRLNASKRISISTLVSGAGCIFFQILTLNSAPSPTPLIKNSFHPRALAAKLEHADSVRCMFWSPWAPADFAKVSACAPANIWQW